VGRITRFGGADREIRVELNPVKLDSFGISAAAVNQQLRATKCQSWLGSV
jgi:multidrug efflux pump subunit AcrB